MADSSAAALKAVKRLCRTLNNRRLAFSLLSAFRSTVCRLSARKVLHLPGYSIWWCYTTTYCELLRICCVSGRKALGKIHHGLPGVPVAVSPSKCRHIVFHGRAVACCRPQPRYSTGHAGDLRSPATRELQDRWTLQSIVEEASPKHAGLQ